MYSTELYCPLLSSNVIYCTLRYSTLLYCTLLIFTALHCTPLHFIVLHCTPLNWTVFYYTLLHSPILSYTLLYSTVIHCLLLFSTELHCFLQNSTGIYLLACLLACLCVCVCVCVSLCCTAWSGCLRIACLQEQWFQEDYISLICKECSAWASMWNWTQSSRASRSVNWDKPQTAASIAAQNPFKELISWFKQPPPPPCSRAVHVLFISRVSVLTWSPVT